MSIRSKRLFITTAATTLERVAVVAGSVMSLLGVASFLSPSTHAQSHPTCHINKVCSKGAVSGGTCTSYNSGGNAGTNNSGWYPSGLCVCIAPGTGVSGANDTQCYY